MRWILACAALVLAAGANASIIIPEGFLSDGRLIESRCEIHANEETLLGDVRPPSPPDDWTETFTICGVGYGHMDSTIDEDFIGAAMWASGGETVDFDERITVSFRLEFEVTEPSLAEWTDAGGTRIEFLAPDTTYVLERSLFSFGPRVDAVVGVRLIPEPTTLALLAMGVGALGTRSLLPERRSVPSDVR